MDDRLAVVSGLGHAGPVRRSDQNAEQLALRAIAGALDDAGIAADQVEGVVTESSLCPAATPLDRIAVSAGLTGLRRSAQSTPVGAGILAAVGMASDMVERGEVRTALTWFSTGWGSAIGGPTAYHEKMEAKAQIETPAGLTGPPLYFAIAAKRYQYCYGLSGAEMEDMLFNITSAIRANAALNPDAQLRRSLDRSDYAATPMIADPLRKADCSLLSDGAVAIVISRSTGVEAKPMVRLAAWDYAVDPIADADFYTQSPWLPDLPAARRASEGAFSKAGLTPGDIDVLGLYDCFSIAIALQLEAAGFCASGQSRHLVHGGSLRHDGALPLNTHGGLMAHGYLLGVNHVAEVITQLRGEAGGRQVHGATRGFAGAGPGRQYTSLIFERLD